MQSIVELGIVLKAEPHKDSGIRCHILTPDGVRVAYAMGAQKANAKLKSAIQLFTIAEFTFTGTRITGAHVIQLGHSLTRDINRYYLACSVCEVLLSIRNTGGQIFYLAARTFESLNDKVSAYKIFINFYTKLLVILGYDIDIEAFKQVDNDKIDDIKLDLSTARKYIKMLCESYETHLDIKIQNADIY